MFRKTALVLAVAALATGTAAGAASAGWKHKHHHYHHHHRHGWVGPAIIAGAFLTGAMIAAESSCYQRQWVETPYGWQKVRVYVC